MIKFMIFNLFLSPIICASFENSESSWTVRPLIACDLSAIRCHCGDLDVVKCKCIEWSYDCPENTTFDNSSCKCLGEDGLEHMRGIVRTMKLHSEPINSSYNDANGELNGSHSKESESSSSSPEIIITSILSNSDQPSKNMTSLPNDLNNASSYNKSPSNRPKNSSDGTEIPSSHLSEPKNLSNGPEIHSSDPESPSGSQNNPSGLPENYSSNLDIPSSEPDFPNSSKTSQISSPLQSVSQSSSNDNCIIPECRPCDELDEVNCICYQVIVDCLPGYINSPDGCDCVRDNSTSISNVCPGLVCTDGLKVNDAYCNCTHKVCDEPIQECAKDWLFDLETCQCVCGLQDWNCQRFFHVDPDRCECRPPPCIPFTPCQEGTKWDYEQCTCYCTNPPNCTAEIYVVDNQTCECVCANQECDFGFIIDELTCECVPEHEPECPPRFVYDPLLCRCICEAFHECPYNFEWDENMCKCICPKTVICGADFVWSDQHCECVCNAKKTCQPNFIFDNKSCDCICDPSFNDTGCDVGFVFDKKICSCVKGARPHCPAGFVYKDEECGCVCAVVDKCHGKGVFDHDTCKCVCLESIFEHSCVDGYFSRDECDCVVESSMLESWNEDIHADWIN